MGAAVTDAGSTGRILALSGGIDSAAILATEMITLCVFVDYGQPAAEAERRASRALAKRFETPWVEANVRGIDLGEMADADGKPGLRIVNARNAIIASLCANFMPPAGGWIYFGAHKEDEPYPDCRADFFDRMSDALGRTYRAWVVAPFLMKTKAEVRSELAAVLRDYDVWCSSCYTPRAGEYDELVACGTCTSCQARAR